MNSKVWYKSLTIWGAVAIGIAAGILPLLGYAQTADAVQQSQPDIMAILAKVGEIIGLILVVIGRIKASKTLTTKSTIPVILLACMLISVCGCSGVQMNAQYMQLTDQATIIVKEFDKRCQGGDAEACKEGCHKASVTLQRLNNAAHGIVDANLGGI